MWIPLNINVDMQFRWRIAQALEWRWWRHYLRDKDKKAYLSWKRTYWDKLLAPYLSLLQIDEDTEVADLGCGPAGVFIYLPCKVTAVDPLWHIYSGKLQMASPTAYPGVTFIRSELENWIPDRAYDAVFCMNVINHVRDLNRCMDVIRNALKPGGHLVITVDAHRYKWAMRLLSLIPIDLLHPHQYSLDEYMRLLTERNFKILNVSPVKNGSLFCHYLIIATRPKEETSR
ncbi:MAG: methyltransferase domain-containing protein [Chitinophagales bacterium]|nr:methyltransferase domain-containing protein [Chitinophagales bacterium]MDW8419533.1 class I SAM-dependent methyltransferase [Chitinophagales bacterium]